MGDSFKSEAKMTFVKSPSSEPDVVVAVFGEESCYFQGKYVFFAFGFLLEYRDFRFDIGGKTCAISPLKNRVLSLSSKSSISFG